MDDVTAAIRAWLRLDRAIAEFNRHLRETYGVTGAQLAMLRIVAEDAPIDLAELRSRLAMHPATMGQLVQRLEALGLVARTVSTGDRRRRRVAPTAAGARLLASAPLAGPVRLREVSGDPERLRAVAAAFDDAVALFGLEEWAP